MRWLIILCSVGFPAGAASAPAAILDHVVTLGGVDEARVEGFVERSASAAGWQLREPSPSVPRCGPQLPCLRRLARSEGRPVIGVTVVEVAGSVTAIWSLVGAGGETSRRTVEGINLSGSDPGLGLALRSVRVRDEGPGGRAAVSWALVGASAAMAIAGSLALVRATSIEDEFLAEHVDAEGNLMNTSLADARREQQRSRRWQWVGGALFGGAALAGGGAAWLFWSGGSNGAAAGLGGRF